MHLGEKSKESSRSRGCRESLLTSIATLQRLLHAYPYWVLLQCSPCAHYQQDKKPVRPLQSRNRSLQALHCRGCREYPKLPAIATPTSHSAELPLAMTSSTGSSMLLELSPMLFYSLFLHKEPSSSKLFRDWLCRRAPPSVTAS